MDSTFTYMRLRTPVGVKVELVSGASGRSGRVWELMARQVYCENGKEGYRAIDHLDSGAPLLCDSCSRISLSHTDHLLAVGTLPETPHVDLDCFNPLTAMGIDAERLTRDQVLKVRARFLSEAELALADAQSVQQNILAWTCKEAVYKAMLTPGLDLQQQILLTSLPALAPAPENSLTTAEAARGHAEASLPGKWKVHFSLYSFEYEGCAVTIATTAETVVY